MTQPDARYRSFDPDQTNTVDWRTHETLLKAQQQRLYAVARQLGVARHELLAAWRPQEDLLRRALGATKRPHRISIEELEERLQAAIDTPAVQELAATAARMADGQAIPQAAEDALDPWLSSSTGSALDRIDPTFDEPAGECRKSAKSAAKPRLELVPYDCIEEIAEVLTYGANKYEANNWTRGARWGRYFAALLRHGFAWWRGEDRDPETGFSHLAHLGCNLVFLMSYQRHGWGKDDRFRGPDSQLFTKHDGFS